MGEALSNDPLLYRPLNIGGVTARNHAAKGSMHTRSEKQAGTTCCNPNHFADHPRGSYEGAEPDAERAVDQGRDTNEAV